MFPHDSDLALYNVLDCLEKCISSVVLYDVIFYLLLEVWSYFSFAYFDSMKFITQRVFFKKKITGKRLQLIDVCQLTVVAVADTKCGVAFFFAKLFFTLLFTETRHFIDHIKCQNSQRNALSDRVFGLLISECNI